MGTREEMLREQVEKEKQALINAEAKRIIDEKTQQMRASKDREQAIMNQASGYEQGATDAALQQREDAMIEQMNNLNAMGLNPQDPGIPFDYNADRPDIGGLKMGSNTLADIERFIKEKNAGMNQQGFEQEVSSGVNLALSLLDKNNDAGGRAYDPGEVNMILDQNFTTPEVNATIKNKLQNIFTKSIEAQGQSGSGQAIQQQQSRSPYNQMANQIINETAKIGMPEQQMR